MSLKNRFENYTQQPDPEVWESVRTAIDRPSHFPRKAIVSSCVVLALFGASCLLWHKQDEKVVASAIAPVQKNEVRKTESATQSQNKEVLESSASKSLEERVDNQVDEKFEPVVAPSNQVVSQPKEQTVGKNSVDPQTLVEEEGNPIVPVSPALLRPTEYMKEQLLAKETVTLNEEPKSSTPTQSTEELAVWIPNAFAPEEPNNDKNRVFKVIPSEESNISSFKMYIYSRSGRLMFKTTDFNVGWDGTANGHVQPMGAYVYVIEYYDNNKGKLEQLKGTLTLIR